MENKETNRVDVKQFRKKPVIIEAEILFKNEESIRKCLKFMGKLGQLSGVVAEDKFSDYCTGLIQEGVGLRIKTLESDNETQIASFGDYIIKGVNGEFYPCKPDIFEKTYEAVDGNQPPKDSLSAEEFVREKIRKKLELTGQMNALHSYSVNGEECLRWAHEYASQFTAKEVEWPSDLSIERMHYSRSGYMHKDWIKGAQEMRDLLKQRLTEK